MVWSLGTESERQCLYVACPCLLSCDSCHVANLTALFKGDLKRECLSGRYLEMLQSCQAVLSARIA